jgi:inosine-uridine nucleoside N-ribohydrolase
MLMPSSPSHPIQVHLDTDLGGDIDDLCALAMLLRWQPALAICGITTTAEAGGRRAGYVRHALRFAGRSDIPVAAGADEAQGFYRYPRLGYYDEITYWGEAIPPAPGSLQQALDLLEASIESDALVIAIGPFTNLALLEQRRPGILEHANLVLMGGHIRPIRPGYPTWDNTYDWNFQVDTASARFMLEHSHPTLVPLTVTVETALRREYLPQLASAGPLGALIARQAQAFAADEDNERKIGTVYPCVPDDLINFQHDALACAIGLGWREGVVIEELPLHLTERGGWLYETIHPDGKPTRVVTAVDGETFSRYWLAVVSGEV